MAAIRRYGDSRIVKQWLTTSARPVVPGLARAGSLEYVRLWRVEALEDKTADFDRVSPDHFRRDVFLQCALKS